MFVRPPLKSEHETMNEESGPRLWKGQHGVGESGCLSFSVTVSPGIA